MRGAAVRGMIGALGVAVACTPDPTGTRCSARSDCASDQRCEAGQCLPEVTPRIESFTATHEVVPHGTSVTVSWRLGGAAATALTLDGASVLARTSSTVVVRGRRGLQLVASNGDGSVSAALELAGQGLDTFAGFTIGGVGSNDGVGAEARMMGAVAFAVDADGYVYFTDHGLHTVRRLAPDGEVVTFAGYAGRAGAVDGSAMDARFVFPKGIAVDRAGTLYVADNGSGTIRTLSRGLVTTWAGVAGEQRHVDGTLAEARFDQPDGLVFDSAGNLFVSESHRHDLRKITPEGAVSTFAGSADGFGGLVDGTGLDARFLQPGALAIDGDDTLYLADTGNHAIRKITADAVVTTLAGGGAGYVDGAPDVARFHFPQGVAVDGAGHVFVADQQNHAIRRIDPDGTVVTWASASAPGWGDGRREGARFFSPYGLALDPLGRLFVGEVDNHTIRRLDPDGLVTTVAGKALVVGASDGPRRAATFLVPRAVTTTTASGLPMFVGDSSNHTVRRIDADGTVTTIAGAAGVRGTDDGVRGLARFDQPWSLVVDVDGSVLVVDSGNSAIRRVGRDGTVTTIAGRCGEEGDTDGAALDARFRHPHGAVLDASGNLYVADTDNACIRKVSWRGTVSTFAGRCGDSAHLDELGTSARFVSPASITWDSTRDRLYVADATTVRAIVIDSAAVETVAGQPGRSGFVDGPVDTAFFGLISAVVYDPATDALWVTDQRALRRLSPPSSNGGRVDTIAGTNLGWAAAEAGPLPGYLGEVWGLTVAGADLFVATPHGVVRITAPVTELR